ncbi:hypothetical protein [Endozoicomonas atrinae]|uniref:hypothetical protein n=1 Tax=Endozoicomonas atrinae TaxID=1333660 RepID=UPI0019311345|nr:hypothetical protein [Endozoicomonas atrinae]
MNTQTFGKDEYCLYVLPELDEEFGKSQRLQNNFSWAEEEEYRLNRQHFPVISKKQTKEVDTAFGYIWNHIISVEKGPSPVDARYLAYAYVLGITVVTDDIKMLAVAETFGIKTLKSLDLMKLMVECDHIDMSKVREIVSYWRYWGDMPAGVEDFKAHYLQLFDEDPP